MAEAWSGRGEVTPGRTGHTLGSLQTGLRVEHQQRIGARAFDLAAALVGIPARPAATGSPGGDGALLLQGMLAELAAQELPGPGGAVLGVDLDLHATPAAEEEVTVSLKVTAVHRASGIARLAGRVTGEGGRVLAEGQLRVRPAETPVQAVRHQRAGLLLQMHPHIARIEARAAALEPMPVAIAWPADHDSLLGPLEAARRGLIRSILVGDAERIGLAYLAGAEAAGMVLGARVPVILTGRADSVAARVASAAMARLVVAAGG